MLRKIIFITISVCVFTLKAKAQCTAPMVFGPLHATTATPGFGTGNWLGSTTNIMSSNNFYTENTLICPCVSSTYKTLALTFAYSGGPSSALMCGYKIVVEARAEAPAFWGGSVGIFTFNFVGGNKSFVIPGYNLADAIYTLGGTNDLWGSASGTIGNLSSGNFNVGFNTGMSGVTTTLSATYKLQLDEIQLFVYYDPISLPLQFLDCTAKENREGIEVTWHVLEENKVVYYQIESSANGVGEFSPINVQSAKEGGMEQFYSVRLEGANKDLYYRVKAIGEDGKFNYSEVFRLKNTLMQSTLLVYPNPSKDGSFNVKAEDGSDFEKVVLVNALGQEESFYTNEIKTTFKGLVRVAGYFGNQVSCQTVVVE